VSEPSLIGSGREADVYALDGGRVLRRTRNGRDVSAEAAVMAYVHSRGFPVPAVHDSVGPDLILERVDGPTMLHALTTGAIEIEAAARVLADLHHRLHALPAAGSEDPDVRILHLDLHPDNFLLGRAGPVLIDWRNATEGPPDRDLAVTALILAQVAVDDRHAHAADAAVLLRHFLECAGGEPAAELANAVAFRRSDPTQTAREIRSLVVAAALVRASINTA
jgi:aminoglycoside phosphotransferase (APT) family kinase protein